MGSTTDGAPATSATEAFVVALSRPWRPRWLAVAAWAAVAAFSSGPVRAQEGDEPSRAAAATFSDNEVKAAFLYNFGTYVQWPAIGRSDDVITIAVLGSPAIAGELEQLVPGRTIQGIPVRVRRLRTINELTDDEVLFIGSDENWRLSQLIDAVEGSPTLIVTDAPDGLSDGAMINFQLIDRRVRFEISLLKAQEAGLMLSSRLLSAALRVETTRCRMECQHDMQDSRADAAAAALPSLESFDLPDRREHIESAG